MVSKFSCIEISPPEVFIKFGIVRIQKFEIVSQSFGTVKYKSRLFLSWKGKSNYVFSTVTMRAESSVNLFRKNWFPIFEHFRLLYIETNLAITQSKCFELGNYFLTKLINRWFSPRMMKKSWFIVVFLVSVLSHCAKNE